MTPRQACPQPNGFRRNLRSKTRWFTGFCNSHQVSHFATFFIDARAKISVVESHFIIQVSHIHPPEIRFQVSDEGAPNNSNFLGAFSAGVFVKPRGDHIERPPPDIWGQWRTKPPKDGNITYSRVD